MTWQHLTNKIHKWSEQFSWVSFIDLAKKLKLFLYSPPIWHVAFLISHHISSRPKINLNCQDSNSGQLEEKLECYLGAKLSLVKQKKDNNDFVFRLMRWRKTSVWCKVEKWRSFYLLLISDRVSCITYPLSLSLSLSPSPSLSLNLTPLNQPTNPLQLSAP